MAARGRSSTLRAHAMPIAGSEIRLLRPERPSRAERRKAGGTLREAAAADAGRAR